MKKSFTFLVALAILTIGGYAHAQSVVLDRIKKAGTIRVGVKTDFPPFGFLNPAGQVIGLEPDMAQDVAKRLGVKLELVPVQSSNRIEFLQQGRIDLMIATLGVNDQRRKVLGYIEPFYYAGGTSLLVRKDAGIKRWEDIKGRDICATQGASYNRLTTQKYGPNLVAFPGNTEALNALLTGSCIGFLQDSTLHASMLSMDASKWAAFETPLPVEDFQPWGIAVALDELGTAYGDQMRQIVTEWHRSGYLLSMEKQWALKPSEFLKDMQARAIKAR